MKPILPTLQAHLNSGATTLCWCWKLTRRDGVVQGFTDHDKPLIFDSITFEAASGFTASDIKDAVGLSVDNLDVSGALSSTSLNEDDLAAGIYDDAAIAIYRVNWADPTQRVLMRAGSLGEIKRTGTGFTAEVRGLAHYLQQPKGRLYQYSCDADVGDTRCGVALTSPQYTGNATISGVLGPRRFTVAGLSSYAHEFFSRGLVTMTSGAAGGTQFEVKLHSRINSVVTIELWTQPASAIAAGDTLTLTAGCDKQFATCRGKFGNSVRFRGFPSMPGNDYLTRIARKSG